MSFFVNDIVNNMCQSQFTQITCTIHYEWHSILSGEIMNDKKVKIYELHFVNGISYYLSKLWMTKVSQFRNDTLWTTNSFAHKPNGLLGIFPTTPLIKITVPYLLKEISV